MAKKSPVHRTITSNTPSSSSSPTSGHSIKDQSFGLTKHFPKMDKVSVQLEISKIPNADMGSLQNLSLAVKTRSEPLTESIATAEQKSESENSAKREMKKGRLHKLKKTCCECTPQFRCLIILFFTAFAFMGVSVGLLYIFLAESTIISTTALFPTVYESQKGTRINETNSTKSLTVLFSSQISGSATTVNVSDTKEYSTTAPSNEEIRRNRGANRTDIQLIATETKSSRTTRKDAGNEKSSSTKVKNKTLKEE